MSNRRSRVLVEVTVIEKDKPEHQAYIWWCPGCAAFNPDQPGAGTHIFHIPPWSFDGNMKSPTFEASYLSYGIPANPDADPTIFPNGYKGMPRCHSFVRNGTIQYLNDCEHSFAGKTIPMAYVPNWLRH